MPPTADPAPQRASVQPIAVAWSHSRSAATVARSSPVRMIVLAAAMTRTMTTAGRSQDRTGTLPAETSECSLSSGGLAIHSAIAPRTTESWQMSSATGVGRYVAARTPRTGPTRNVSSVATESTDRTVVRWESGTWLISTWRTIEKLGTANTLATPATTTSGQYPSHGAMLHATAPIRIDGSTVARSPTRSSRRPRHGLLIDRPIATTVETMPASA